MYLYFFFYTVLFNAALSEALFFWKEKPLFFCFKVCPLYCSKDTKRRRDVGSLIYVNDEPPTFEPEFWVEDFPDFPPPFYYGHWTHPTKMPKTTTPMPTTTEPPTTTPEPTYICVLCEQKCGGFKDFPPPFYYGLWTHPTKMPKTTTPMPTTTEPPTTTPEPTYICVLCEQKCGGFKG